MKRIIQDKNAQDFSKWKKWETDKKNLHEFDIQALERKIFFNTL